MGQGKTAKPNLMARMGNALAELAGKGIIVGIILWAGVGYGFSVKREIFDVVRMPQVSANGYTMSREVLEPVNGLWQYLPVFNRNGNTRVKVRTDGNNGLAAILNNTVLHDNNNNGLIDGEGDYVVKVVDSRVYWYRSNGKVTEPDKDKSVTKDSVAGLSKDILAQANDILNASK